MIGITILGYGLEGYFPRVGGLKMWTRVLFVIGGFLIALPEWRTTIAGILLVAAVVAYLLLARRRKTAISTHA
jgi:TRAP-type uncharacterized transport system fused permease subunit